MLAISLEGWICSIIPTDGDGLVAKSCPTLVTPWTVAFQAPLSMGFSRQKYWSGLPFSSPGDLPDPGNEPRPPALQADSLPTELQGKPIRESKFFSRNVSKKEEFQACYLRAS